jgi:ketosteroid isomerase-like protein
MSNIRRNAKISIVLVVTALACAPPANLDLTLEDLEAAQATVEGYVQAVVDGVWDEATAYFSDDAVRLPMNAPAERGKATIREHFQVVDSVPDWTVHVVEVDGSGDVAYVTMYFTITAYFGRGADPFTYTGKQLAVLSRQQDGRWLIVTDIWNGDAGPA